MLPAENINGQIVGDVGNTFDTPWTLTPNVNNEVYITGSVGWTDPDVDIFRFVATGNGTMQLTLGDLSYGSGVYLNVFDEYLNYVTTITTSPYQSSYNLYFSVDYNHEYFVEVYPQWDTTYSLNFQFPQGPANDYVYEIVNDVQVGDVGDYQALAWFLREDSTIQGWAGDNGDIDVYRFVAAADDTVTIDLTGLTSDLDLFLLDANFNTINSSTAGGSSSESITANLVEGNTYYIEVYPFSGAVSEYTLTADLPEVPGENPEIVNSAIIGDAANAFSRGYELTSDAYISGSVGFDDDSSDFFTFTMHNSGYGNFNLDGTLGEPTMRLYVDSGHGYTSIGSGTYLDSYLESGKTYFLKVSSADGEGTHYVLNVDLPDSLWQDSVDGTLVAGGDAGQTVETTGFITGDCDITGSTGFGADEFDAYAFTAAASGQATFEMTGLSGDLDLYLFDSSINLKAYSTMGSTNAEQMTFDVVAGQSYYLCAIPDGFAESNYEISVNLPEAFIYSDSVNGVMVPGGDAGQTEETAGVLTGSASIMGSTGFGDDVFDAYQFTAEVTGYASFEMSELEADLDLYLFDSALNLVAVSDNPGVDDESISAFVDSGETYYLLAFDLWNESNYQIEVSLPSGPFYSAAMVDEGWG